MITAETAISRFRRDLAVGSLLRGLLLTGAAACVLAGPMLGARFDGAMALLVIGAVWLALSYRSVKGSRLAADSPSLIASGQFDQAENQIDQALRSFSIFRTVKLLSLHHLAVLRHAQRRWQESAMLCRALLSQKLGNLQALAKPSRLLLADSLLQLGDLNGVYRVLSDLYYQRLSLVEALTLQTLQLDYLHRIGAWEPMIGNIGTKVQLAELMGSNSAARSQAMMALAAQKLGKAELSSWLRRRAELLVDPQQLVTDRPVLRELWQANAEC